MRHVRQPLHPLKGRTCRHADKRHVRRKAGKEKKMDVNATNIEEIVRQVLNSMEGHTGAGKSVSGNVAGEIPKTARVAMLTSLEHYDIK